MKNKSPGKFKTCLCCLLCAVSVGAAADTTPPTMVSAASLGGTQIGIRFSEPVELQSATDPFNYLIDGESIYPLFIVMRPDGESVLLELNTPVIGTFSVEAFGITDLNGVMIEEPALVAGEVWAEANDVIGPFNGSSTMPPGSNFSSASGEVEVVAGGTDIGNTTDEFHFVYQRRSGDFDVKVQVTRLDAVHTWSKAGLMARESLDGESAMIMTDTAPLDLPGAGSYESGRRRTTGAITETWGTLTPTDLPNAWIRLKKVGDMFRSYHGTDGVNWAALAGPVLQPMAEELLVGMMTTSHSTSQSTVAEYRNFGDLSSAESDPGIVGLEPLEDWNPLAGERVQLAAFVPGTSGYTYQWQKDGVDLAGATGPSYEISSVSAADEGSYRVVVRNEFGSVESSEAELILSEFLIPFSKVWRYETSGTDLGTSWREPTYDDALWPSGPGPLGFETTPENLPLQIQTPFPNDGHLTYYFRSTFNLDRDPTNVELSFTNLFDDGGVVYINGLEAYRVAIPAGEVSFSTLAGRSVADAAFETLDFGLIDSSFLVRGENRIAVEMHQTGSGSSDMVFGLSLLTRLKEEPPDPAVVGLMPLDDQTRTVGERVVLQARSPYRSRYAYQWQRDEVDLPGATDWRYVIPTVSLADAGSYTVVVWNEFGAVDSSEAELTVLPAPEVLIPFSQVWRYEASGTDLGTSWKEPDYNDAFWLEGPGPLGFETTPEDLPVLIETPLMNNSLFTYYFRSTLTMPHDPADVELVLTSLFDDGAVIYINGTEVYRIGLGTGPVNFFTPSLFTVNQARLQTLRIPSSALVQGENQIAVEMHQVHNNNSPSSDLVFGLSLAANLLPLTNLVITTEPRDLLVEEFKATALGVEATGNGARYQWFQDGVAITGATQSTYEIESPAPVNEGTYHVVVSNLLSVVQSRDVSLTVVPDTTAPAILKADGTESFTTVVVHFSEKVDSATASNIANYTITNTLGGTLAISQAVFDGKSTVVLTTASRQPQRNYLLQARNITDLATLPNAVHPDRSVPLTTLLDLIDTRSQWFLYDTLLSPPLIGTAWTEPGVDTGYDWCEVPGAFVLDSDGVPLPIPTGQILDQGQITTYFRREFNFEGSPVGATLRVGHYIDDGAVVYLNGIEIMRYNMPEGLITSQTPALSTVPKASRIETEVPGTLLVPGINVMAVELHGMEALDTDLFFDMELQVEIDSFHSGPLIMTESPQPQSVTERGSVTFSFVSVGPVETVQWELNGQPIAGATQPTYTVTNAGVSLDGASFAVLISSIAEGSFMSDPGILTVVPDLELPQLLFATGHGSHVRLEFSEPLDLATAMLFARYGLEERAGGSVPILAVAMGRDESEVVLTTGPMADGVEHRVEVNGLIDQAASPNVVPAGSAASFTTATLAYGLIKREYYGLFGTPRQSETGVQPGMGIPGVLLEELTAFQQYPDDPRSVSFNDVFELNTFDQADLYGARLSGFFIPDRGGAWNFYLAGDDEGELWLSTDEDPANLRLIAREPQWYGRREWVGTEKVNAAGVQVQLRNAAAPENLSTTLFPDGIDLVAGQRYYIEALVKEGGGADHLAVAVQGPGDPVPVPGAPPIPGRMLATFAEPLGTGILSITHQPESRAGEEMQQVTFQVSVDVSGAGDTEASKISYRWQRNGVDIPGATSPTYTTPLLTLADDGSEYRVISHFPSGSRVISDPAVLSVVANGTPATLQIERLPEDTLLLYWERAGYLLQESDSIEGPWGPAARQISPTVVAPSAARGFFRLIRW